MIVRHGQSSGNVARDLAEAQGLASIDIAERDMDVPLSALGREQARALGTWLAAQPAERAPTHVLASPYARARQTAELAMMPLWAKGIEAELVIDERLREREFGIIDRLTRRGIEERYPEQAELYSRLKKFYYRPPGGESWCDVILRLRSALDSLSRDYAGARVMIVCHTVVVYGFRYLFEKMTEEQILGIDRENEVANCSVTTYRAGGAGELELETFNFAAPLEQSGAPVTSAPDVPAAPK